MVGSEGQSEWEQHCRSRHVLAAPLGDPCAGGLARELKSPLYSIMQNTYVWLEKKYGTPSVHG